MIKLNKNDLTATQVQQIERDAATEGIHTHHEGDKLVLQGLNLEQAKHVLYNAVVAADNNRRRNHNH